MFNIYIYVDENNGTKRCRRGREDIFLQCRRKGRCGNETLETETLCALKEAKGMALQ